MLEAYTPSGSEARLAELLNDEMASLGFHVARDQVGNVIGEVGERGPKILLCGHMDTVPGEIPVRLEDDWLYGRGAVDAKSALAAMLLGCNEASKRATAPFRATVVGAVEEETSSRGVKSLISQNSLYDLAVFGEPSGVGRLIIGYKGSLKLRATFQTLGGHSAAPWLSRNSLEESFEFWKTLKRSLLQNDSSQKFTVITGCITGANAGESEKSIPKKALLNIDVRIPPDVNPQQVIHKIANLAKKYEQKHPDVRTSLEFIDQCPAYIGPSNSIAVQAFRWAVKNCIGGQVELLKKTGTSDMNLFAQTHHVPMIAYGPGDSALDHTENERIFIREYLDSVEVLASAIERIAVLYRDRQLQPVPLAK
jgi:LysW-gamma-L-lysine carboxypeptidase